MIILINAFLVQIFVENSSFDMNKNSYKFTFSWFSTFFFNFYFYILPRILRNVSGKKFYLYWMMILKHIFPFLWLVVTQFPQLNLNSRGKWPDIPSEMWNEMEINLITNYCQFYKWFWLILGYCEFLISELLVHARLRICSCCRYGRNERRDSFPSCISFHPPVCIDWGLRHLIKTHAFLDPFCQADSKT